MMELVWNEVETMLNFEEELKKFKPSLEVEDIEDNKKEVFHYEHGLKSF